MNAKEDPIVQEVRAARAAHAAKHGGDLDAIFADLKRREQRGRRKVASFHPRQRSESVGK